MELGGKHLLVTGGNGFIGRHVCRLLKHAGVEVTVLDLPQSFVECPHDHFNNGLMLDICGALDGLAANMQQAGVEGIFHMSVLPLGPCTQDPRKCLDVNVRGTFNVLMAAAEAKIKRVVFSSASSVYGDTDEKTDETHPFNARTMYGASKIAGEALFRAFSAQYGLPYAVLRYMNVYGPGQKGGVIWHTLNNLANGRPPRINGDGKQSFDFVYVEDVARANLAAMQSDVSDEAFNVGGDEEFSINDIVATILGLVKHPIDPEYVPAGDVPMFRRVGSSEKAKRQLGFTKTISFPEGIRRVIAADFPQLLKERA